jgi:quinol monooxygenase YgiN
MLIIHVFIQVKPEFVEMFKEATLKNARASINEPGIIRFDVFQESNHSDRFLLVEVYRTDEDPARHKETAHYNQWKDTVEHMMAVQRTKKTYDLLFPGEDQWI